MVVVGEREVGQRSGPRRPGRDALQARTEPIAEVAEPAAADDHPVVPRGQVGLAVEKLEGVLVRRRHAHRLRSHECAAAGPGAREGERAAVAAHEQGGVGGGKLTGQRDADRARAAHAGRTPSANARS